MNPQRSSQFVQMDDTCSDAKNVKCGVPQGSIQGPVLFNIYVADFQENLMSTAPSMRTTQQSTAYHNMCDLNK